MAIGHGPKRVLSYVEPTTPRQRFAAVRAAVPFSAGVPGGGILAALLLASGPAITRPTPWLGFWPVVFFFVIVVAWLYVVAAIVLFCCISSRQLQPQSWWRAASVGLLLPLVPAVAGLILHVVCVMTAASLGTEGRGLMGILLLTCTVALPIPALLVSRYGSGAWPAVPTWPVRRLTLEALGLLATLVFIVAAWRRIERSSLDCRCAMLAAWVKATYPGPGACPDVPLPPSFTPLAADGSVDAVVLADGRVVLVLKTAPGWHHNWSGFIFASGPIQPNEIGTDPYGRPEVTIPGLPMHFIERPLDDRHILIRSDLE